MRKHLRHAAALAMAVGSGVWTPATHAQNEPYLGQLMVTAANYCPVGWARADGQLMAIQINSALFALLGTTYGGDGRTTFGLPDLRGRAPLHVGQGLGLTPITQGESSGAERITLLPSQLPAHTHPQTLLASTAAATHSAPAPGRALGQAQNAGIYTNATADTPISAGFTGPTGSNQPIQIRNPYLGMLWCIATEGIFPMRP